MHFSAKEKAEESGKLEGLDKQELDQLFWDIGLGALKYFILKVDPKKRMIFNPEESIELQGNTGPFIQYTYTRTQAILAKAASMNSPQYNSEEVELSSAEKEVITCILDYPEVLTEAGKNYSPALIANYAYELAKTYNHFYQSIPILKEDNEHQRIFRIKLSQKTGENLKSALALLGIRAPKQM